MHNGAPLNNSKVYVLSQFRNLCIFIDFLIFSPFLSCFVPLLLSPFHWQRFSTTAFDNTCQTWPKQKRRYLLRTTFANAVRTPQVLLTMATNIGLAVPLGNLFQAANNNFPSMCAGGIKNAGKASYRKKHVSTQKKIY